MTGLIIARAEPSDARSVVTLLDAVAAGNALGLTQGEPHRDGTEADMETRRIPFEEALGLVDSGEIHDSFTR